MRNANKRWTILLAAFLATAAAIAGQPGADADWKAWQEAQRLPWPKPSYEMTLRGRIEFAEQRARASQAAAARFLDRHPDDPRRWEMVLLLSPYSPRFVLEWGASDANGRPTAKAVDEGAAKAWEARVRTLKAQMAAAPDLPEDLRTRLARQEKMRPFYDADPHDTGAPVDLPALRARLEAEIAADPASAQAVSMVDSYMSLFSRRAAAPDKVSAEWRSFVASAHEGVRNRAEGQLRFMDLAQRPLEVAFTAIDGREVDLKRLRGKVVLLHFWATWCGSCVAEMPAVIAAYRKHHDRGLEIVGISSDRDRQKLLDYVQEKNMPWPQYFQDSGGKNRYTTLYGIRGIPTKFLLDREGRLVSARLSGADLDAGIAELLAAGSS